VRTVRRDARIIRGASSMILSPLGERDRVKGSVAAAAVK
jgi:hypothetical protein